MTGEKRELRVERPMRHRNARVGRPGNRRTDTGHDLEWDAGRGEFLRLLTAASEDKRITAFQPRHGFPFARPRNQQGVRLLLPQGVIAGLLPRIDRFGSSLREAEEIRVGQVVVNDHIGLRDTVPTAQSQQPGITGTRSDQKDGADGS